ncbi:WXG100 family type VII secretion target [Actinomadura oligospora]|uniref:WXG100 family type VII secretion target n=1 Tax=Actinomadura oligospora TaxID=111804 RepID=UPI0004795678|nr:WXG100 family type VII secretion target [Actinomadura oligospora]
MLVNVAHAVLMATEVLKAYKALQKTKPKPAAIRKAAGKWYDASSHYDESSDILKETYNQLGGYWEGKAFDAFKGYMTDTVLPVASKNSDALFAAGDELVSIHNDIVDRYNDAMQNYADTLDKALELQASIGEAADKDAKAAAQTALINYLRVWISRVYSHTILVKSIADKGAGAMTSLSGKVEKIRAPRAMPPVIADRDKWKYSG